VHFFGTWADPEAALAKYLDEKDDLQAGRTPRRLSSCSKTTTGDVVNLFLERCEQKVKAGELALAGDSGGHQGRNRVTTEAERGRPAVRLEARRTVDRGPRIRKADQPDL